MQHNNDAKSNKNESQRWCKKITYSCLFQRKEKECIRKMMQYIEEMHQNNDADHDEIPFSFKERVYQEEIDIKMHQNSDAILVD